MGGTLVAGACALPASPQPVTYEMCAVDGGARLVNNTLVELGKAQFTYKNASCNYPCAAPLCMLNRQSLAAQTHICTHETELRLDDVVMHGLWNAERWLCLLWHVQLLQRRSCVHLSAASGQPRSAL